MNSFKIELEIDENWIKIKSIFLKFIDKPLLISYNLTFGDGTQKPKVISKDIKVQNNLE